MPYRLAAQMRGTETQHGCGRLRGPRRARACFDDCMRSAGEQAFDDELYWMHLATPASKVAQRTGLTSAQKTILDALDLPEPPRSAAAASSV